MKRLAVAALVIGLAGCTTAQLDTARGYQDKLAGACKIAVLLPLGPVSPWIASACSSEAAIATLALDSTSLDWLRGIVWKAKLL